MEPIPIIFDDKTRVGHLFSLLSQHSGKIEVSSFDDIYFKGNYILDGTNSPDDKLVIPGAVLKDFDVYIYPSGKVKLTRTYRESETYRPEFTLTISGFEEVKFSKWGLEHPGFLKDPDGKYIVTESNSIPRSLGKDMSTNSDGPRSEVISEPRIIIETSNSGKLLRTIKLVDASGTEICSYQTSGIGFESKDSGFDYEFTVPEHYSNRSEQLSTPNYVSNSAAVLDSIYKQYTLSIDTPVFVDGQKIGLNQLGLITSNSDEYLAKTKQMVSEYRLHEYNYSIEYGTRAGLPKEYEEIFRKFKVDRDIGSVIEKASEIIKGSLIEISEADNYLALGSKIKNNVQIT